MRRLFYLCRYSRTVAILALLALAGCVATAPKRVWDTASISRGSYGSVQLYYTDEDGKRHTAGYVDRATVGELRQIVDRIASVSSQRVDRILISDQDQANASAGFDKSGNAAVIFTIKMLALLQNDRDAMAALVGHEIAHLVRGHGEANKKVQEGASAAGSIVGLILQAARVPMGGTIGDVGAQLVATAYSRDQEREADDLGIRYSHQAGYDPEGAVRLFHTLERANATFSIPFLSTHPMSSERIEKMRALANDLKSR